jgi:hypothetical protein
MSGVGTRIARVLVPRQRFDVAAQRLLQVVEVGSSLAGVVFPCSFMEFAASVGITVTVVPLIVVILVAVGAR